MANERQIVDAAGGNASSNLQYNGTSAIGFSYRNIQSGDIFDSVTLIEGAKGNPPTEDAEAIKSGATYLSAIGIDGGDGLYKGNNTAIQSRKYNVNVQTSGTGNNTKVTNAGEEVSAGEAVHSTFNRWSLFKTENISGKAAAGKTSNAEEMSKSLYNGPALQPTARNIVNFAKDASDGDKAERSLGFDYDLTDFVQCEHYGMISNNFLITLRRFPYPVQDDIISPKIFDDAGKPASSHQPDIARALTWLSPSLGNDLKEIFKFKVGYNWKEVESEIQEITNSKGSRGLLGSKIDGNTTLSAVEAGLNGLSAGQAAMIRDKGAGWDPTKETYPNKVLGPYNVIKKILAREQGLVFEQDFTLTFHYDIRGYGNTSPKAAFMDTMSNLLALTYSNAPFWGGATRYLGSGSVGKPFGDYNKLKNGDYAGFLGGLKDQFMGAATGGFNDLKSGFDGFMKDGLNGLGNSKILDNIVGGGLMKLFNGPAGAQIAAAMISGDPTGNWHLTIGNPMAPMMVIGNLCLQDAQFEFEGPLGYEDFPSKLKLTVTLKPGRARDKGDIESMFNAGRGRMYLQPEFGEGIPQETIATPYGGTSMNDALYRRVSDMNNG